MEVFVMVHVTTTFQDFVSIVRGGLHRRGFDEDAFLKPLDERLESKTNPGQLAHKVFTEEGVEGLIKTFAVHAP